MAYFSKTSSSFAGTYNLAARKPLTRVFPVSEVGYRYYKSELARWQNRDPIGEQGGGLLLYGFVGNSPVNGFDPVGLRGNDPPSQVSAPCCGGKVYDSNQSCCHNNEVIPVVSDSSTSYKVCCRAVQYDPGTDPWWGRWVFPKIRHCEIKSGACSTGEESYDISKSSAGNMGDGKPCRCSNSGDISACLGRHPYSAGGGTWGDNCQANTVTRLGACCLQSSWRPNCYGNHR